MAAVTACDAGTVAGRAARQPGSPAVSACTHACTRLRRFRATHPIAFEVCVASGCHELRRFVTSDALLLCRGMPPYFDLLCMLLPYWLLADVGIVVTCDDGDVTAFEIPTGFCFVSQSVLFIFVMIESLESSGKGERGRGGGVCVMYTPARHPRFPSAQ